MKMSELKSMSPKTIERRKATLENYERLLKEGTKQNRGTGKEKKVNPRIPLTTNEVYRIKKQIAILKARI